MTNIVKAAAYPSKAQMFLFWRLILIKNSQTKRYFFRKSANVCPVPSFMYAAWLFVMKIIPPCAIVIVPPKVTVRSGNLGIAQVNQRHCIGRQYKLPWFNPLHRHFFTLLFLHLLSKCIISVLQSNFEFLHLYKCAF